MVPLIGGMNNEPCRLTASGEGLSGEGLVSSKYRHELLGAATYKPVVFSKFVNGVYNIKVWPRFWGGIQAQPFFQFRPSSSGHYFEAQRTLVVCRFRELFQQPDGQRYLSFKRRSRA